MSIPVIAFFSTREGIGRTSLVYHLAWMYHDLGRRILVADLDPQANLTERFLDNDRLEQLWPDGPHPATLFGAVQPLLAGDVDVADNLPIESVSNKIGLLAGDLALAQLEEELAYHWQQALDGPERPFRTLSALWRVLQRAAAVQDAEFILLTLGSNLGAINRTALIACDYVVTPLAADLISLQDIKNIGPMLRRCRQHWTAMLQSNPSSALELPTARIKPVGYIIMQRTEHALRVMHAHERSMNRIAEEYSRELLGEAPQPTDEHLLGSVRQYRSLIPMAQEARKPMFHLTSADGAIGAHTRAVLAARVNYVALARELLKRCNLLLPIPASR